MDAQARREWVDSKSDPRTTTYTVVRDGDEVEFVIRAFDVGQEETYETLRAGQGPPDQRAVFEMVLPTNILDPDTREPIFGEEHVERAIESDGDGVYAELKTAVVHFHYGVGQYSDRQYALAGDGDDEDGDPGNGQTTDSESG